MTDTASRRRLAGVLLAAGLMLLAACGGDDENGASGQASARPAPKTAPNGAITVQLVEENDSGASGAATLTDGGDGASVTLEVRGGAGRYHAHIHDVSCDRYRRMKDFNAQLATVSEGLTDLTGGRSKSDLTEPLSSYTRPRLSINVHGFAAPYPVVACGDLSAR